MKWKIIIVACAVLFVAAQSFIVNDKPADKNDTILLPRLSGYNIFKGKASDLIPDQGFMPYELSTTLFSDYAEKQRLIKLPPGSSLKPVNNGLPEFPDGTILAKTFFYFNDKRDTTKGKRVIETRILIKTNNGWNAGTYKWNAEQTEADLISSGGSENVQWIDKNGERKNIKFQIPTSKQCGTCHNSNNELTPIGFKIQNLNIDVLRQGATVNQLTYFHNSSIMEAVNPHSFSSLPDWKNTSYTLEQRARAYLEVNCAHCHNDKGYCAKADFHAGYELSFEETNISKKKGRILNWMKNGTMPLIGTTVVHKEGVALIEEYVKSLK